MYNRYQGNSGRVRRVEEPLSVRPAPPAPPLPAPFSPGPAARGRPPQPPRFPLESIMRRSLGSLETEDVLLLLILYLMYRESGDSELLLIMGAMFLS